MSFEEDGCIIHKLPKIFRDSKKEMGSLLYKQILRNEDAAIYEVSIDYKDFLIGYEVFLIKKVKINKHKILHIFEKYPKSPDKEFDANGNRRPDDFGKTAFSYANLEWAKKKYDQLCLLERKKSDDQR